MLSSVFDFSQIEEQLPSFLLSSNNKGKAQESP
jgi:hypothetical protein